MSRIQDSKYHFMIMIVTQGGNWQTSGGTERIEAIVSVNSR
jgi:hypothetical protein